jgi:4a-hydroxytetrahydrobiopterin dehydratase
VPIALVLLSLIPLTAVTHAMHIDVSLPREHAEQRLAVALAAGDRIVDDSQAPRWWTLTSRRQPAVSIATWPDGVAEPDAQDASAG